ncbi:MAG: SusD/RagB family nutrient-binding outer membrane lipoprotein [Bacteroidales bacterium]|nr:SusD/RagB family nutrient-binding outer membrane lipoprotein [Bacteroidales bacterium]
MKLKDLKYLVAVLTLPGVTSCMEFDNPADEFAPNEVQVDATIYQGDADALDFTVEPTEAEVDAAMAALETNFANVINAQTSLLGGKDGAPLQEHYYQIVYNMTVDCYAGFFTMINSSFMSGTMETTYSYHQGYCEGPYGRFLNMKNDLGNFLNRDESNMVVELKAVALLMFDIVAQENTDIFGSIPYVDHKGNKETNPFTFNKGIDIYYSIIKNLDDINACLLNFENRPQWYKDKLNAKLASIDQSTITRSFDTWRRLANSLKLRMAMHLAKVSPDDAKRFAEEAVAAGVIDSKNQQVGVFGGTSFGSRSHCVNVIMRGWNDIRMNASFISLLSSLKHPYMNYLFAKNNNQLINQTTGEVMEPGTEIVGVRAGLRMEPSQQYFSNMRFAYSTMNYDDPMENANWMPFYLMKWAEVDFLRAEGALRGWDMGGTAEFFYNRGIDNADCSDVFSMPSGDYEKYLAEYKELTEAVPYTYVDPMDSANNIESVTKIGVKWDEADDQETKLEKIITQKYISAYPHSYEAWVDLRRTGYPKQFPVLNPTLGNDGSLSDGDMIRRSRLPWGNTIAGQEDVTNTGLEAIGGPDVIATRVFWDIPGGNF